MTISFTNSVGYTRSFSTNEITIVITNLNATNSYYTNGLNDLLYVRIKEGNLLLFDLTFRFGEPSTISNPFSKSVFSVCFFDCRFGEPSTISNPSSGSKFAAISTISKAFGFSSTNSFV